MTSKLASFRDYDKVWKERVFEQFLNKLKTILLTELPPPKRSNGFPYTGPTAENTQDPRVIKTVVNRTSGPLVMNGSLHRPRHEHLVCKGQRVGGRYFYLKADKDCMSDLCRVNNCYCKYKYSNFVWSFAFNKLLSVNFTFISIKFVGNFVNYVGGILHCSFGQLNVLDTTTKHKTFIFCGQYSLLFVFPEFCVVEIEVSVHPSVVFDIQALFTVLDRGLITSLNRWSNSESFQKFSLVHTVGKTDSVFTMEINLNKMFHIVVRTQAFSGELLVFDGPGHLSPKVQPKGTLFTTTSFQSLMVITCTSCLSNITMRLDYCSKPVTPHPIEIGNASFLQLPGVKYCGKNQCLLKLVTESQMPNVSVVQMQYEGVDTETCQFGGLASFHVSKGVYKEYVILCQRHSVGSHQRRSFYGVDFILFLVLYWYQEYSNINSTILLTTTRCQPVQMCPCQLQHLFFSNKPDHTAFQRYIERQIFGLSLELLTTHSHRYQRVLEFYLKQKADSCVTLQLTKTTNCPHICSHGHSMTLTFRERASFNTYLKITARGSLNNKLQNRLVGNHNMYI